MKENDKALAQLAVDRFVRRFGNPSYRDLAYHAALPFILTSELLNYLRHAFLRGLNPPLPWVAEADLLLSDLCSQVGYEQFAMKQVVRDYLMAEMRQRLGNERLEAVARLLLRYVNGLKLGGSPFGMRELQTQELGAMLCIDDQRVAAVRELATMLQHEVILAATAPDAWHQGELTRLARLTQGLSAELSEYPELLRYAEQCLRELGIESDATTTIPSTLAKTPTREDVDVLTPLTAPASPARVAGIELPVLRRPGRAQASAMRKCPFCGFANKDGALFCEQCKSDVGAVSEPVAKVEPVIDEAVLASFSQDETNVLAALTHFSQMMEAEIIAETAGIGPTIALAALGRLVHRTVEAEGKRFALVPGVADFMRKERPQAVEQTGDRLADRAYALIVENGYNKSDRFPTLGAAWPTVAPALPMFLAGPNPRLQTVCDALANFLTSTNRGEELLSLFVQAETKAATAGDHKNAGWRAYQMGRVYYDRQQADAVVACADRAARYWESAETGARERSHAILLLGQGLKLKHDYPGAVAAFRESLDLYRTQSEQSLDVANALSELATTENSAGDVAAAERHFHEALQIARAVGAADWVAMWTGVLAELALDRQDWSAAEALARDALNLAEELGRQDLIADATHCVARALIGLGNLADARPYAQHAMEILTQLGSPVDKVRATLQAAGDQPVASEVFLCHLSADAAAVRELAALLQQRGLSVWLDQWELTAGRHYEERLEAKIRTMTSAVVTIGKEGRNPLDVDLLRASIQQMMARKAPVAPVLLPGAPEKADARSILQGLAWTDFRDGFTKEGLDHIEWVITGDKPKEADLIGADAQRALQKAIADFTMGLRNRIGLCQYINAYKVLHDVLHEIRRFHPMLKAAIGARIQNPSQPLAEEVAFFLSDQLARASNHAKEIEFPDRPPAWIARLSTAAAEITGPDVAKWARQVERLNGLPWPGLAQLNDRLLESARRLQPEQLIASLNEILAALGKAEETSGWRQLHAAMKEFRDLCIELDALTRDHNLCQQIDNALQEAAGLPTVTPDNLSDWPLVRKLLDELASHGKADMRVQRTLDAAIRFESDHQARTFHELSERFDDLFMETDKALLRVTNKLPRKAMALDTAQEKFV